MASRFRAWAVLAVVCLALLAGRAAAADPAGTAGRAAPHARAAAHARAGLAAAGSACDPTASLRPSGPPSVPPGSYMATIRARGHLIAGVDASTYRFGYLNPFNTKFEGFDIDMLHAVAAAIFGDPNKIQFKAIPDAERIPAIQSGSVDIVAHTMTITCERLQLVDFSTVYFDAGQRVLVQSNSPAKSIGDLGKKKVCATKGSSSLARVAAAPSHPVPVAVTYWTDCLVLLQQGEVDAVSTDDSILAGLAAQDPFTRLVGPRFSDEPYGLAISVQHPDFVRFVNAVLERIRADGRWAASYAHWFGKPAPAPPRARYRG